MKKYKAVEDYTLLEKLFAGAIYRLTKKRIRKRL